MVALKSAVGTQPKNLSESAGRAGPGQKVSSSSLDLPRGPPPHPRLPGGELAAWLVGYDLFGVHDALDESLFLACGEGGAERRNCVGKTEGAFEPVRTELTASDAQWTARDHWPCSNWPCSR